MKRQSFKSTTVNRRGFLKFASMLGSAAIVGPSVFAPSKSYAAVYGRPDPLETESNVEIKYSVCLACHSACGIRCKVVDGVLMKVEGNPYHPNTLEEWLPYDTDPEEAKLLPGRACAKGQSGVQVLYDPHRIKQPLKRIGPRGSGEWEPISWDQAVKEIGDKLLELRDLDTPIDPNAPELGPVANKVVFSGGRNEHGQKEFTDRFWGNCYGTVNKRHDHTSICETSHHIAYSMMTGDSIGIKGKTKSSTDFENAECIIFFGTDPCAANFPFVAQSRKLVRFKERGGKLIVVDPRFNVAASKADIWVPIKPGADAAFALGIARFLFENNKIDTAYLSRPHKDAVNPNNESTFTDATHLVKLEEGSGYLRGSEAGIGAADDFIVWSNGQANANTSVDSADLFPGVVTVNGIQCKTSLELYRDRTIEKSLDEYATISGVEPQMLIDVATEYGAHGKRSNAEHYRGAVQHTNGTYNGMSIIALNLLVGNIDWQGGQTFGGSHWHEMGGKDGNLFSPANVPNGVKDSGTMITRVKKKYEDSSEFASKPEGEKYPAKRPWFPFAFLFNYQEIIPSIDDQYPYPAGALFLYWNDIAYSTPAAKETTARVLKDESKIPLIVNIDIEMGETTVFSDYILPDTTYLERWSTPHVGSAMIMQISGVRQPVVGDFNRETGDYIPFLPETKTMEDIHIALGKYMNLPGFGENASVADDGTPISIDHAWDWHRQLIGNIASEGDGVPGSTLDEKIDYVLARGGRFEGPEGKYEDDGRLAHRFGKQLFFFSEVMATARDSMTGQYFNGHPLYEPIKDHLDRPIQDEGLPLTLVTYKQAWHSMARTINNPWLVSLQPENFVEMHTSDAAARGIRTGDVVIVKSATSPDGAQGRAYVTETIRPGVVAVAHSFGHWEMFSKPHTIGGVDSSFEETRAAGIAANPIMRSDPVHSNVTLQDKIGGSCAFSNTNVEVVKS